LYQYLARSAFAAISFTCTFHVHDYELTLHTTAVFVARQVERKNPNSVRCDNPKRQARRYENEKDNGVEDVICMESSDFGSDSESSWRRSKVSSKTSETREYITTISRMAQSSDSESRSPRRFSEKCIEGNDFMTAVSKTDLCYQMIDEAPAPRFSCRIDGLTNELWSLHRYASCAKEVIKTLKNSFTIPFGAA
jgi:hypothetical protein